MQKIMLLDKYPVYTDEIRKSDTSHTELNAVISHLKEKILAHAGASYIGEFDHYAHVAAQPDGTIAGDIKASQHLLFCVANAMPNPLIAAVRPRSLSVVELNDRFIISYLEPPVEAVTQLISSWVGSLRLGG